jgi:hypothetical protein
LDVLRLMTLRIKNREPATRGGRRNPHAFKSTGLPA